MTPQRIAAGAGLLLALTACSTVPTLGTPDEIKWASRRAQLTDIEQFTMQARISEGGVFGARGTMHWQQSSTTFRIRAAGPFGSNPMTITGQGEEVEIRTAREQFTTRHPERTMQERLGWALPIRHLRWWALGLPAPGPVGRMDIDALGRLTALEQDGWSLTISEYQVAPVTELPRILELVSGDIEIKVVVDTWTELAGTP